MFGWHRLRALLHWLPADSALARDIHGEAAFWGLSEQLLAGAVDALRAANWQRGGGKGRRPRPIERPGLRTREKKTEQIGGKPGSVMSLEEAKTRFRRMQQPTVTTTEDDDGEEGRVDGD